MGRYLASRLIQSIFLFLIVTVVTFSLVRLAPGGPEALLAGEGGLSLREMEQIRRSFGLDQPLTVQYVRWLSDMAQGDLGKSYQRGQDVTELVLERLPGTLILASISLFAALTSGILLGIVSAYRRNSLLDRVITVFSQIGLSIPNFWLAILLIIVFAVQWQILPTGGMYTPGEPFSLSDRLRHLVLPALVLTIIIMPVFVRYTRSSMITALDEDYVRTAKAKGLGNWTILGKHALRNALIPVVTVLGVTVPRLFSGTAIIESVFSWPGLGSLAVQAAIQREYQIVMGITIVMCGIVLLSNLVVDLLYPWLDPRVKLG